MNSFLSKHFAAALVLLAFTSRSYSQIAHGTVQEGITIDSKALGKPVRYTVYLPPDYESSHRLYPVVYLLHGYTDNDTGWLQFGEANRLADEGIASGAIPPMILVMPDGGVSFYINNFDNSLRFEDFFTKEFIPFIEGKYRIRAEKQYRGIAGLSMGGYGTLVYALRHPDLFAACAAFSSAVLSDEEVLAESDDEWNRIFGPVFGTGLKGKDRITDHLKSYSPLHLVREAGADKVKSVRFYIDCGDDDSLGKGNALLHILLSDLKIPHEFRVRDGGHSWGYWRTGLPEGLKFIGTSFRR